MKKYFLILALLWWALPAGAADLPQDLQYSNQPIHPLCIDKLLMPEGDAKLADLSKCPDMSVYVSGGDEESTWPRTNPEGFFAYGYKYKDGDESGYINYKYIGTVGDKHLILVYQNTGGTGQFSYLIWVMRKENALAVTDRIAGGDRCNGGIHDARLEEGKAVYTVNITPPDILDIAKNNPRQLKAYEDLEASAASCFFTATFEDQKLVSVKLNEDKAEDTAGWTEGYTYQSCFNKVYNDYVDRKELELDSAKIKEFTDKFNSTCPAEKAKK
jgi:hypothetical protein